MYKIIFSEGFETTADTLAEAMATCEDSWLLGRAQIYKGDKVIYEYEAEAFAHAWLNKNFGVERVE